MAIPTPATPARTAKAKWAALALLASLGWASAAAAQSVDCASLAREIAAQDRRSGGDGQRFARAAERQRVEIERTVAYGVSIGCWKSSLFSRAPDACPQIDDRVARMRANLDQLLAQADRSDLRAGGVDRETLRLEYDAWCRGRPRDQRAARDPLSGPPGPGLRRVPLDDMPPDEPDDFAGTMPAPSLEEPQGQTAGSRAICVRGCDGGYFPLSVPAKTGKLEDLQELCRASCPNVEARLYTLPDGGDVARAVSAQGELYSAHPRAFLFRKKYDPACACKPAGKTWGQVLGEAEKIIGKETGVEDQSVTPQQAETLSKPAAQPRRDAKTPDAKTPDAKTPDAKTPDAKTPDAKTPPARAARPPQPDPAAAPPQQAAPATSPPQDGETREVVGPDGVKRKVRIVGPKT